LKRSLAEKATATLDASHPAGVRGLKRLAVAVRTLGRSRTPQGCVD